MKEEYSSAFACVGFLFWIGMGYFMLRGDRSGALTFGLLGAAAAAGYAFARSLRARRKLRERARPPKSDLPEADFSDVKPSDFE
ncbi:MAG: hypothetical protein V3V62_04020 [bacterium]